MRRKTVRKKRERQRQKERQIENNTSEIQKKRHGKTEITKEKTGKLQKKSVNFLNMTQCYHRHGPSTTDVTANRAPRTRGIYTTTKTTTTTTGH